MYAFFVDLTDRRIQSIEAIFDDSLFLANVIDLGSDLLPGEQNIYRRADLIYF